MSNTLSEFMGSTYQGLQGLQGIQGVPGSVAAQGVQGLQGSGSQGLQGTTGIQGAQGIQGLFGLQGTQGIQGTTGTQGAQGIQGSFGLQGIQGIQGIQGTSISAGFPIANGTSNINAPTSDGNINISVGGTANVLVTTSTGVNVTGTLSANSVITRQSTNQDGIELLGRAGGTGNYKITVSPETLSASRTVIIPDSGESSVTLGYREIPQNSESASYTLQYSDLGKHIYHPSADTTARTWIIPQTGTDVGQVDWPLGATISFINGSGAGVITIQVTSDTLRLAGPGTTGTRDIAANGIATCIKVTSTEWLISGTGIS